MHSWKINWLYRPLCCDFEPVAAAAIRRRCHRWSADRFFVACQKPSKRFMLRSGEVETVKVHDFVPGRHEVLDKLLLRIRASVDLGQSPELGVRTENEVDTGAGPLECARCAIATSNSHRL